MLIGIIIFIVMFTVFGLISLVQDRNTTRKRLVKFIAVYDVSTGKIKKKVEVTHYPENELKDLYNSVERNLSKGEGIKLVTEYR